MVMQRRFKIIAACGGLFVAIGLLILIAMCGQRDDAENKIIYGVACLENGKLTGVNVYKRFSMHSVMKFPQALYVAHVMKERSISLEDTVSVIKSELMPCTWSPMLSMIEEK